MRHSQGTVVFAQGWLGSELTRAAADVEKDGGDMTLAKQVLEYWQIIDEALEDMIREQIKIDTAVAAMKSAVEMLKG
jgi:hypothetical protein